MVITEQTLTVVVAEALVLPALMQQPVAEVMVVLV
jgi:hypothetical protein